MSKLPDYKEIDPGKTLLVPKELAHYLRVNVSYVYSMRKAGFVMPAGKCTIAEAREWLGANPDFRKS